MLHGEGCLDWAQSAFDVAVNALQDNDGMLDTNEQRVITSSSGNYAFSNLGAGTYKIRIVLHSGFVQTFPTQNFGNNATLAAGQSVTGKNFGADN